MKDSKLYKIKNTAVLGVEKSSHLSPGRGAGAQPSGGNKINVGGASVFSLLVVLCLAVFAVISVMTAKREYLLSEKAVATASVYYELRERGDVFYKQLTNLFDSGGYAGATEAVRQFVQSENDSGADSQGLTAVNTVSVTVSEGVTVVEYYTAKDSDELTAAFEITESGVYKTKWQMSRLRTDTDGSTDTLPLWSGPA
ncbi:hypothetical protein FACS1894120_3350 [Clostridia bacterium]|nr:hypothetical protein FACS1894120_3350 [Clostridia bacterium]